jgi:hypothetical protein
MDATKSPPPATTTLGIGLCRRTLVQAFFFYGERVRSLKTNKQKMDMDEVLKTLATYTGGPDAS